MGRDLTPREHRALDQKYGFSKQGIQLEDQEGNKFFLHDPNSQVSKRYPLLSYLLGEHVLSDMISSQQEKIEERLDTVEETVKTIIENEEAIKIPPSNWYRIGMDEMISTVAKWYDGVLDPNFYYGEKNRNLFIDFILKGEKKDE